MLIDTHLHLSDETEEEISKIIDLAKDKNVNILILGGCSVKENAHNLELVNKYRNIYTALGYHPDEVHNVTDNDIRLLEDQANDNKKVIAIGEIGLDYHYEKDSKEKQKDLFRKQLNLASKLNLPVVIHSRDASFDTYNILKEYDVRGVIHCFSESLEMAKQYISLGYLLGIGGVVTFENSKLKETVKEIDLSNIIFETDSPYLSPLRGKKNNPSNIQMIASCVAELKEIDLSIVSEITTKNARNLFDLNS
jgi:hydrolase, TatD family